MQEQKNKIAQYIDSIAEDIGGLARDIHANPELGYEEFKALGFISAVLEKHGFTVQKGYGGLPTSFRADAAGQPGGPRVAFLAEYDALAGVGHACGHNLIAACSTAAFMGMAQVVSGLKGSVCIIGTPAEEGGAGKVKLLRAGAMDDVSFAMMMHPSSGGSNLVGRGGRAACTVTVEFHGKGAHSSSPKSGINALNAVISVFNQLDMMRPTFEMQDNINGVILDGGTASNIIPAYARAVFCVRADTMKRIEELNAIIKRCAENAEHLIGAKASVTWDDISAERYPNKPMNQAFKDNMAALGIEMSWPDPKRQYGSSDVGNVSIKMPAIHDYLSITDDPVVSHSADYTAVSATPQAIETALKGAKGLAMTAYDILVSPEFQAEILKYHDEQIPEFYKK